MLCVLSIPYRYRYLPIISLHPSVNDYNCKARPLRALTLSPKPRENPQSHEESISHDAWLFPCCPGLLDLPQACHARAKPVNTAPVPSQIAASRQP